MISQEMLQAAIHTLVADGAPRRIVLFGSYARADATEDSDLDLLVIEDEVADRAQEMVRLHCTGHCVKARSSMDEIDSVARVLLGAARDDAKALAALIVLPDIADAIIGFHALAPNRA
jgi:nucleotidyltransferase-like protein